jgi:flagellar protein FlaJ
MSTFLPQMAKAAEQAGGTMFIKNFSLSFNRIYFYHTVLIQGFFSGIMAGVLGEGDYRSGLKHSVIMISVAFILFRLFV